MLFIQTARKNMGCDVSLYEMEAGSMRDSHFRDSHMPRDSHVPRDSHAHVHGQTLNVHGQHGNSIVQGSPDRKMFNDISMISYEQELVDELNSMERFNKNQKPNRQGHGGVGPPQLKGHNGGHEYGDHHPPIFEKPKAQNHGMFHSQMHTNQNHRHENSNAHGQNLNAQDHNYHNHDYKIRKEQERELANLRSKNESLQREIEFLQGEKDELLMEESFVREKSENILRQQINEMTDKVTAYRKMKLEAEKNTQDHHQKNLLSLKEIEELNNQMAHMSIDATEQKHRYLIIEKSKEYYTNKLNDSEKKNEELTKERDKLKRDNHQIAY